MTYRLELEVDIQKTDPNRLLGASPRLKHRLFQKVKDDILKLSLSKRPLSPLTSFKINVVRHSPRFLDYDNLISSLKPAIDGLRLAQVIKDDSWEYIRSIDVDQKKSKIKKLFITVEEV